MLYPDFAKVAEEEGFPEIANAFKQISKVEAEHERRYLKAVEPHHGRQLLQARRQDLVAVPQLRIYLRSGGSAENLPGMPAPAGILRAEERQLLTEFFIERARIR